MLSINYIIALFVLIISLTSFTFQEITPEEEYYTLSLMNLLKQKQYLLNQQQQQLQEQLQKQAPMVDQAAGPSIISIGNLEKRTKCLKRNANCDGRLEDCCPGSTCRCTIIGSNCRCQRPGLFQKFF